MFQIPLYMGAEAQDPSLTTREEWQSLRLGVRGQGWEEGPKVLRGLTGRQM